MQVLRSSRCRRRVHTVALEPALYGGRGKRTHVPSSLLSSLLLLHFYFVCLLQLPKKLDVLWSFIKSHLKSKCVVFMSSCKQVQNKTQNHIQFRTNPQRAPNCTFPLSFKQVKFIFEAFSRMRPGVVLMAIHGKVKQMKRIQVAQCTELLSHFEAASLVYAHNYCNIL